MKLKLIFGFLFLTLTLVACGGSGVDYPVDYFNASVTASASSGEDVILTIESTGFYDMVVDVTIRQGTMTSYDVKSHEESEDYGAILINGAFIDDLVAANGELSSSELDAYAGATATRDALIDVAKAAVEHYNTYYNE